MWRSRLWLLYWVSTAIRSTPALTRFDNAKSIIRYSPPNGTAGLARSRVNGERRLPSPPASTRPSTFGSAISCLLTVEQLTTDKGAADLSDATRIGPECDFSRPWCFAVLHG